MAEAVLTRPDGRPYRPRKDGLRVHAWENPDSCGVIVFGTLDPDVARTWAEDSCSYWYGSREVVDPEPGWYRDTFRYGERQFAVDEARGVPGVRFTSG